MDYETTIRDELENWPGVGVTFSTRSKHGQAVLSYGGRSRFVVIPHTPGDGRRGARNAIRDVRKELAELGAQRAMTEQAQPRRRKAPKRAAPARPMKVERAPVKADPFAVLATIKVAEPPRLTWLQRLWARVRQIARKSAA